MHATPTPPRSHPASGYATPSARPTPAMPTPAFPSAAGPQRRQSPWHEISHSLSTTSLPHRAASTGDADTPIRRTPEGSDPASPAESAASSFHLSGSATSQALRDWERLLAQPDSDVTRHTLVHGSPLLAPTGAPKLAAERDKEGHIEYKLKLVEPSPERFQRLVTQMMWRLKQGRNEAIYELGLADDGTVIGLTRAEMDASLRTLELMASEVGATVIVLKEIVLQGAPVNPPNLEPDSPSGASAASASDSRAGPWRITRPDLDEHGRPRKGTRGLNGQGPEVKSRRERYRDKMDEAGVAPPNGEFTKRHIIFDREADASDEADSDVSSGRVSRDVSAGRISRTRVSSMTSDDEPPAFRLDLDDAPTPERATPSPPTAEPVPGEAKRRKAAARREARRLDLLRGDGTSAMPYAERSSSPVAEFIGHAPAGAPGLAARLPHQPARPSSLRLERAPASGSAATSPLASTAASSPLTERGVHEAPATGLPDDVFLDGLNLPLDSLSLSFADVRNLDSAAPSAATSPETPAPVTGGEMICVEALVVRKPLHDGVGGADESWVFGGDDDGWGFGAAGGGGDGGDDAWGFDDEE
ncbi:hypothetical protein Q8F55_000322 [Vanrija albida]|uniref:Uncharacterized protein n=1 Tax=Vanrija albida TaxID=181172 RepID=A0ABR3QCY2_9TREE